MRKKDKKKKKGGEQCYSMRKGKIKKKGRPIPSYKVVVVSGKTASSLDSANFPQKRREEFPVGKQKGVCVCVCVCTDGGGGV